MKKIIIFDLDGTLINSDPITINAINQIAGTMPGGPLGQAAVDQSPPTDRSLNL